MILESKYSLGDTLYVLVDGPMRETAIVKGVVRSVCRRDTQRLLGDITSSDTCTIKVIDQGRGLNNPIEQVDVTSTTVCAPTLEELSQKIIAKYYGTV
jgi:hypothetical protein